MLPINPAPAATSNLLVLGAGFQHSGYVLANISLLIALSMVFKYLDNDSFFLSENNEIVTFWTGNAKFVNKQSLK